MDVLNTKEIYFSTAEENLYYKGVYDIDPQELAQKLKSNAPLMVIDVRQPDEFHDEMGGIPGSKQIVLETLDSNFHKLFSDRPLVFVCRNGSRSAMACALALSEGFKQVYNLKGGMILWNECHLPTEI